jgi:hypothetical protein
MEAGTDREEQSRMARFVSSADLSLCAIYLSPSLHQGRHTGESRYPGFFINTGFRRSPE